MNLGSIFTGYGGLDMAAQAVLGTETVWHCDNDPAASALLAHHWPGVPNLGDITAVDWTQVAPIDVLTGGFPCQDISSAGKREGITGARSSLWGRMVDAVRVLRPRYVLVENVSALVVRGLDVVLADLAALGFDAEWTTLRASEVGAPHRRERVFIVAADARRTGHRENFGFIHGPCVVSEQGPVFAEGGGRVAAHTFDDGREWARDARHWWSGSAYGSVPAADAGRDSRQEGRGGVVAHACGESVGQQPVAIAGRSGETVAGLDRAPAAEWGGYAPAIRRWEHILGRPAPEPTVVGARSGRVLNPALTEWMMGLPQGWITSVPGVSRNAQLKLAGNGVVPQQAAAAIAHLLSRQDIEVTA